ncbi:CBS domain-containing protein [Enterococcus rivorum]|uniref:CBS domain-containing protein n=1 Tax=Enterococcus rivorum TaxID=762845 RepID=A0A1E5KWK2_9ENTE|nr:CBS domain-containing protein [Enterococcus rivorum]MBP2100036.1 putative transcriptional regulator [Enterococcus rivorum]OEH82232.1 hypothetical protein BCR26_13810 [Enterococcus rivorum]
MGQGAETFLNSFNRVEKWLREQLNNSSNIGFSEMVRRLARKKGSQVGTVEEDLLQMAQLRNAIVHERISQEFIIAEPNEWAVNRMVEIEQLLVSPAKVLPRFSKKVTGFETNISIKEILAIVVRKRYSQFPIYKKGIFQGLITVHGIGFWFAMESEKGEIYIEGRKASELLEINRNKINYHFVNGETTIFEAQELFSNQPWLEAILITRNADPNGNLLGIIRPKDLYKILEKE